MEKSPNSSTFLLHVMQENWQLSREAEGKRSLLATINLLNATALQIVIVFTGFQWRILPITCWMILISIYGLCASLKLYERSQFHIIRARKLRAKLSGLYPDTELEQLFQCAEQEQRQAYPLLVKVRLNTIWTALHALIGMLGVLYTLLCLLH